MTNNDTTAAAEFTVATVYGETVAQYATPTVMDIQGRTVYVSRFATASEYGTPGAPVYWFAGSYAKKDGTMGKASAHNLVTAAELPDDVRSALAD